MSEDKNIIEPTPFTRPEARRDRRAFRLRPLPTALGTLFVILAMAVAFMFSARAVHFSISPEPETLRVSSGFFTWRVGGRFLMLPGRYHIHATRQGYEVLDKAVAEAPGNTLHHDFSRRSSGCIHRSEDGRQGTRQAGGDRTRHA